MSRELRGRRRDDLPQAEGLVQATLGAIPRRFWKVIFDDREEWPAQMPDGQLGSLAEREVSEYPDGTISVGDLLQSRDWGGFLECGVWRQIRPCLFPLLVALLSSGLIGLDCRLQRARF